MASIFFSTSNQVSNFGTYGFPPLLPTPYSVKVKVASTTHIGSRQSESLKHHDQCDDPALRYSGRGYGGRRGRDDDGQVRAQRELKSSNLKLNKYFYYTPPTP